MPKAVFKKWKTAFGFDLYFLKQIRDCPLINDFYDYLYHVLTTLIYTD